MARVCGKCVPAQLNPLCLAYPQLVGVTAGARIRGAGSSTSVWDQLAASRNRMASPTRTPHAWTPAWGTKSPLAA